MNFALNHIKIKSNWFDKRGIISKIGCDGFFLYITLYRYHIHNQDVPTFCTSIKALKKETGFTMQETYDLFKTLIRNKIIKCNVTRWDRYQDNDLLIVSATDTPITTRAINEREKEYDSPVSDDDFYISVDLKMMQYYLDNGLQGEEMALYCLIRKWSNNTEHKCWMSINTMAKILCLSNDKVHKMVYKLNRLYLMCSSYRKNGKRNIRGKETTTYRFEHSLLENFSALEGFQNQPDIRSIIDKNIKKWDKRKHGESSDGSVKVDDLEVDSEEVYIEDQEGEEK
ncbi:hypothetical protein D3C74_83550 [compost metagenome]